MSPKAGKILLIGFGNPGRLDDGLGPALAAGIEKLRIPGVTVDSNYQLTVEDADAIARHDAVIFADASVSGPEPFSFYRIEPIPTLNFSSHTLEPQAVLGFAYRLFQSKTQGYVLGIRGYEFNEFGERLSEKAANNLNEALVFVEGVLRERDFSKTASSQNRD